MEQNAGDPALPSRARASRGARKRSPSIRTSPAIAEIRREAMERSVRRLCREVAAVIIAAMADTDTSLAVIAKRLSVREAKVRRWLNALMDGSDPEDGLRWIADIAFAMNCRVELRFEPIAQGIDARSGETEGLDPKRESPVAESDAPKENDHG